MSCDFDLMNSRATDVNSVITATGNQAIGWGAKASIILEQITQELYACPFYLLIDLAVVGVGS